MNQQPPYILSQTFCRFSAVVSLGRNTAGHPKIVHGGLTAAIIDETLGGLMFSLKRSQHITLPGPMFTVGGGFGAGSVGWARLPAEVGFGCTGSPPAGN